MSRPGNKPRRPLSPIGQRRGLQQAHRWLATGLATLLLVLVNILAARLNVHGRFPVQADGLSHRARTLMASTRGEVEVKVLLPRSHVIFEPLRQLLANM